MSVCEKYQIPHSRFMAWDKDDRDKALWHHVRARSTCPHCGTRPEEWDPARGGDLNAYFAVPHDCRGCQQLAEARAVLGRDNTSTFVLRRTEEVTGAFP